MAEQHGEKQELVESMCQGLQKSLPAVFARTSVPELFGKCLAVGTLANLGSENGPPYIRRGKHAIYEKKSFLKWFEQWLTAK